MTTGRSSSHSFGGFGENSETCLNADVVIFIAVKTMNSELKLMKPKVTVCSTEFKSVQGKIM